MQKQKVKWYLFFYLFICWFVQFFRKKCDKSKLLWLALLFKHFLNSNSTLYEWARKVQGVYDLINVESKPKFLCQPYTKQRKKIFAEKELLRKSGSGDWTKNERKAF